MKQTDMKNFGFAGRFAAEAAMHEGLYPGRVLSQAKDLYKVVSADGELLAEVSGKLRFEAESITDFPAVGDFVMMDRTKDDNGNAIIHAVLSRKSAFVRKAAGNTGEEQVVASNIDLVFICASLNNDFNLRRLERYLSIAWDSGAIPAVVLTKADLCDDAQARMQEAEAVAIGVDIMLSSALDTDGYAQVAERVRPGQTIAFIGSSGVGKSTLINRLMGEARMDTQGLRNDDKGRHTTTRRELILLENGAMVIDTPGMRELGMESADLGKAFVDIDQLAEQCRFSDCTHSNEPGCAVQAAIQEGALSEERLASYRKLKKEIRYDGMNSRQIESTKLNEMFSSVGGMKNFRKFVKEKNKRR